LAASIDVASAGIKQLILQVERHTESFFVSHLVFWLMGRYQQLKFGLHIQMEVESRMSECLFTPVIMPSLSTQLVSLQVCSDASIWCDLFKLKALTTLRLTVIDTLEGRQGTSLPAELQLPSLRHLDLVKCKVSVSPLLAAADLPLLETLRLTNCKVPGGICLAGISAISSLKELTIEKSDLQHDQVMPSKQSKSYEVRSRHLDTESRNFHRRHKQTVVYIQSFTHKQNL
jgi:hypothetical protein